MGRGGEEEEEEEEGEEREGGREGGRKGHNSDYSCHLKYYTNSTLTFNQP